ncbi:MAG: DUF3108 domain-containing protein [Pyrinomonadaceae bacterium]|nr:DUF3108 domain-containing protein [Pyrinomonadaceae bacterium]
MRKRTIGILVLVALVGVVALIAQTNGDADPIGTETLQSPYQDGEELVYVGKYRPFLLSFTIADLGFKVSKIGDSEHYFVESKATSRGTLTKLFSFSFLQKIDSTIDGDKLQVLKTKKLDDQGKRVRESEAVFDYEDQQVTYVETDPKDPARPPRNVASPIGPNTQDVVSAVYMLRTVPLAVGKTFIFKISDSGLVYDVPVKVTARERKKSKIGKRWCWRIEPDIFGEGRFIEQKGSLTIWITDDAQRIPVFAKLKTKLGKVEIKLEKLKNGADASD